MARRALGKAFSQPCIQLKIKSIMVVLISTIQQQLTCLPLTVLNNVSPTTRIRLYWFLDQLVARTCPRLEHYTEPAIWQSSHGILGDLCNCRWCRLLAHSEFPHSPVSSQETSTLIMVQLAVRKQLLDESGLNTGIYIPSFS